MAVGVANGGEYGRSVVGPTPTPVFLVYTK